MPTSAASPGTPAAVDVDIRPTSPSGLTVWDRTARERCRFDLAGATTLRTTDEQSDPLGSDAFPVPVAAAVSFDARELTLPDAPATIRDRNGGYLTRVENVAFRAFAESRYLVEVHGPVHCVLTFESGFTLGDDDRTLRFERGASVRLGARPARNRPPATVTTTDRPADVMAAISTFGSSLTTLSPNRSFPAFRQHPPALDLGDELHIPDGVEPPWSGIRIQLPRRLEYVFAAAPLAYYLGATVEPGDHARLVAGGFTYSLAAHDGVEQSLARVLKQTFALDVACRTAGPHPTETHERSALSAAVGFDWESLYDADPAERLERYLSVPFESVDPHIPAWGTGAHVRTDPTNVEALPYLAADLATVRSPATAPTTTDPPQGTAVDDFSRGQTTAGRRTETAAHSYVQPESTGALEEVWVGDGVPIGATKALPAGYRNRFDRPVARDSGRVVVVCNDDEMAAEEDAITAAYDDPEVYTDCTRAALRRRLEADSTLVHFVGHIEAEGFECADGYLDARTLDTVGADSFVLNACTSHEQGEALVERGALGGVATLTDVANKSAVDVGASLARLLADGFSLTGAVDVATAGRVRGDQYLVVGDGNTTLAGTGTQPPMVLSASRSSAGPAVSTKGYPTDTAPMGSQVRSPLDDEWAVTTTQREPTMLDDDEFCSLLGSTPLPVILDGSLTWDPAAALGDD